MNDQIIPLIYTQKSSKEIKYLTYLHFVMFLVTPLIVLSIQMFCLILFLEGKKVIELFSIGQYQFMRMFLL